VRSQNRYGWGQWSPRNAVYRLPDCTHQVSTLDSEKKEDKQTEEKQKQEEEQQGDLQQEEEEVAESEAVAPPPNEEPEVAEVAAPPSNEEPSPKCVCKKSCMLFGCGGCCKEPQPSYWNQVMKKTCCALNTCQCGVASTPKATVIPTFSDTNAASHEHKYCHVDGTPKFAKKTKWITRTVKGKTTVL